MRLLVFAITLGLSLIASAADPEIIYHDKDFLKYEKRALAKYLVEQKVTPGSKVHVVRFDRDKASTDYVLLILEDQVRILVIEPGPREGFVERGGAWFRMSYSNVKEVSFEFLKDTFANQEILYVKTSAECAALYWKGDTIQSEHLRCKSSTAEYLRERSQCLSDKGEWGPMGLAGYTGCVRPFPDANKECTESSQCSGRCMPRSKDADGNWIGACQANDSPFGCFNYIIKGKLMRGPCVD